MMILSLIAFSFRFSVFGYRFLAFCFQQAIIGRNSYG